jgi:hypothetical protein
MESSEACSQGRQRSVSRLTACSRAGGGGVLRAKRLRSTACSGAEGGGVLWVKQSRSTACPGVGGGGVL